MPSSPLTLLAWMGTSMVFIGLGATLEWSWVALVLAGMILLGLSYVSIAPRWNRSRKGLKVLRKGMGELQGLIGQDSSEVNHISTEDLGSRFSSIVVETQKYVEHLNEDRSNFVSILENLVEGVLAFDPKGQVLFTNSSANRILGLNAQAIQGQSLWEIIRNQELAELVESSQQLAFHESRRDEITLYAPTQMVLEVYALPFPYSSQKRGCVLVLHDLTELRRLEQVRAEFIDNVAHELRTPLTAIVGYLETLLDEVSLDTPKCRKFLNVAHQNADRLTRLVNDLRSLSEIESGKVVLRHQPVPLKMVVDEVVEMFQSQVEKKRLNLFNQIEDEVAAWADRDRVIQIVVNLIDNAIKFTSDDGKISFYAKERGERIAFQIQDTGQGIPSNELPRLTERFYRVDRARSREEGGTGLGLSIVKHLVHLLGGTLNIESEVGKGTMVEVVLPVVSKVCIENK